MKEKKFETFFFLLTKLKYFKSSAANAKFFFKKSQQNLDGKLLLVGKKVMLVVDVDKNEL